MIYITYYLGVLFLIPLPADAFMVPIMTEYKLKLFGRMLNKRGSNLFVKFIFLIFAAMLRNSRGLYMHLKKRGVLVVLWVANEDEEFWEA